MKTKHRCAEWFHFDPSLTDAQANGLMDALIAHFGEDPAKYYPDHQFMFGYGENWTPVVRWQQSNTWTNEEIAQFCFGYEAALGIHSAPSIEPIRS